MPFGMIPLAGKTLMAILGREEDDEEDEDEEEEDDEEDEAEDPLRLRPINRGGGGAGSCKVFRPAVGESSANKSAFRAARLTAVDVRCDGEGSNALSGAERIASISSLGPRFNATPGSRKLITLVSLLLIDIQSLPADVINT